MSRRKNTLLSLALIGAVVGLSYLGRVRNPGPAAPRVPVGALEVVPVDATAILRVDVRRLRDSKIWRRLVHERGADRGLEQLRETCGFDPLKNAHDLVIFVRGDAEEPLAHVGFVLRGRFDAARLSNCVGRALNQQGAELRRTEVAGLPAIAGGRGDSRFAFVGDRALLGGSLETVRAIARVIASGAPSAASGDLAASYRRVEQGADLTLVAKTPARWLDSLRRAAARASPGLEAALTEPPLLSLGARLREDLSFDLRLRLSDAASAESARASAQTMLAQIAQNPSLRLLGIGELPERIELTRDGPVLRLRASLQGALLDRTLDLVAQSLPHSRRPAGPDVEHAAHPR
ncbi:MAG: hypothetical protein GXP55_22175 [Deltaproteobacteria bacterium]|nr:hypothetical protein [Deltaproteobacteria bacterium]